MLSIPSATIHQRVLGNQTGLEAILLPPPRKEALTIILLIFPIFGYIVPIGATLLVTDIVDALLGNISTNVAKILVERALLRAMLILFQTEK